MYRRWVRTVQLNYGWTLFRFILLPTLVFAFSADSRSVFPLALPTARRLERR